VAPSKVLVLVEHPSIPALPERRSWNPLTKAWWADIWGSPMAVEFDSSDIHGLLIVAELVDDFWSVGTSSERKELATEIRLQRACFGLSPSDRQRLRWELDRGEAAEASRAERKTAAPARRRIDPRRKPA